MGDIYHANDTQLRRSVVIKVLRKDFEHSKEHTERFEREEDAEGLRIVESRWRGSV